MAVRRATAPIDEQAATELYLFAKNDGSMYPLRARIEANLEKRFMGRGLYLSAKAAQAFAPFVERAAREYAKQYAHPTEWNKIFSASTRRAVAHQFVEEFEAEARIRRGTSGGSLNRSGGRLNRSGRVGDRTDGGLPRTSVARYIVEHRRLMKSGVASSHEVAARLMETYHPGLCDDVMDRIGMNPSSETELRALQRVY